MITHIFLENFKSFGEPTRAAVADLTVLAGANSSGKSSLIQMLLLMAQTLENPRPDAVLDLGGRFIQYAEFREAVYGRPSNPKAEFVAGFEFDAVENDLHDIRTYSMRNRRGNYVPKGVPFKKILNHYVVRFGIRINQRGLPVMKYCSYKKIIEGVGIYTCDVSKNKRSYRTNYEYEPIDKIQGDPKSILNALHETINTAGLDGEKSPPIRKRYLDKINKALNNFPKIQIDQLVRTVVDPYMGQSSNSEDFLNSVLSELQSLLLISPIAISTTVPPRFEHFLFSPSALSATKEEEFYIFNQFNEHFRIANSEIKRYLRSIEYIGPLRAKPERAYLSTGTPIEIGNSGENAVPILWVNQNEKVSNKTNIGESPNKVALGEAVNTWLAEFGIATSFHITKPKRVIYQAEMESIPGSKLMVTIADVGFGVSQLLPVIVAGLWSHEGSTLILEQPEIHLHPKLQAKLANFLICMAELGKRVIVETHSEYLINTLRLRIIEDTTGELQKRIGILFVRSDNSSSKNPQYRGSSIENLQVDEYGKIINWPPDFLPEVGELNETILRAMLDKSINRAGK